MLISPYMRNFLIFFTVGDLIISDRIPLINIFCLNHHTGAAQSKVSGTLPKINWSPRMTQKTIEILCNQPSLNYRASIMNTNNPLERIKRYEKLVAYIAESLTQESGKKNQIEQE
uniref:Uncharacterized protein n=1 Tax=Sphaerodactylus townsendi TaxID=933632 RepID=A0ACB8FNR1_9SAUR